ncbi:MAG: hypothetical protein Kow00127_05840 [Bacteroidales bacterium]
MRKKLNLRKRLIIGFFSLFFLAVLILAGNLIIVIWFRDVNRKLIQEYHELHAIQELKLISVRFEDLIRNEGYLRKSSVKQINSMITDIHLAYDKCTKELSPAHSKEVLQEYQNLISIIDSTFQTSENKAQICFPRINMLPELLKELQTAQNLSENTIRETTEEIVRYEKINSTVILHGTSTLLVFSTLMLTLLALGSIQLTNRINQPIQAIIGAFRKVEKGEKNPRLSINSGDEFEEVSQQFYQMVTSLERTTVSRNFLDRIINQIFEILIITDNSGHIKFVNNYGKRLLGYDDHELAGKFIDSLFPGLSSFRGSSLSDRSLSGIELLQHHLEQQREIAKKDSGKIPVILHCAPLSESENQTEADLIIVGHNITRQVALEKELETARRKKVLIALEAQEQERMRFAADLHDGLGQLLTAISYSADLLTEENPDVAKIAATIRKQVNEALAETKNLAHNLMPTLLKDFGLIPATEQLVSGLANRYKDKTIRFQSFGFEERISPNIEKVLYRVCQEALNNIVKHAEATQVTVQLFRIEKSVVLEIEDNGKGFDTQKTEQNTKGIGLYSMKERVLALNGDFTIHSEKGYGTILLVEIPYKTASNEQ